uniref:Coxsackievirus and adenovirus receptor-like n=1 Tax=Petromyzon marinus TaxID=7757 RepID=A0AAJ7UJA0_PETMA
RDNPTSENHCIRGVAGPGTYLVLSAFFSGATSEGDASLQCSKFGSTVSVCTKRFVIGVVGGSVLLPCTFLLRSPSSQVSVEWRLSEVNKGAVIFNSSNNNYTDDNFRDRLRLLGDPGKGDASILIVNLKHTDINTYFCRIKEWEMSEQRIKEYIYYGHHGTRLLVKGTCRLGIEIRFRSSEGDESLQCSNFSDMASVCTEMIVKGVIVIMIGVVIVVVIMIGVVKVIVIMIWVVIMIAAVIVIMIGVVIVVVIMIGVVKVIVIMIGVVIM